MAEPNFVLISELQMNRRRSFYAANSALLNPLNANPILDGEWLELDSNYKLARGSGEGKPCVYPVHTEKGRYDTQAIGKLNVIMMDEFEAETKIVTLTSIVVGDHIKVGDVSYGGQTRRGVLRATGGVGATTEVIVGTVTKVLSDRIRFVRCPPRKLV